MGVYVVVQTSDYTECSCCCFLAAYGTVKFVNPQHTSTKWGGGGGA